MVPMMSGHRDADGRLKITTEYETIYDKLRAGHAAEFNLSEKWSEQFELVIRADSIVTATPFSTAVYSAFNPNWKEKIARQDQPAEPQEIIVEIKRRVARSTNATNPGDNLAAPIADG